MTGCDYLPPIEIHQSQQSFFHLQDKFPSHENNQSCSTRAKMDDHNRTDVTITQPAQKTVLPLCFIHLARTIVFHALYPYTFLRSLFARLFAATIMRPRTTQSQPPPPQPLAMCPRQSQPDITDTQTQPIAPKTWTYDHELVLPPELLTITLKLLLPDWGAINHARLVNKIWCAASLPAFAESFNGKIFHPTPASLECLKQLAESESMVPYIKQLNISTVRAHGRGG